MNRFSYDELGNVIDHEPKQTYPSGKCILCGKEHPKSFEEERDQNKEADELAAKLIAVIGLAFIIYEIFW